MNCCSILYSYSYSPQRQLPLDNVDVNQPNQPTCSQKAQICVKKLSCVTQNPLIRQDIDEIETCTNCCSLTTTLVVGLAGGYGFAAHSPGMAVGIAFGSGCVTCLSCPVVMLTYEHCCNQLPTHASIAEVSQFL